jgi:hypothetical protein
MNDRLVNLKEARIEWLLQIRKRLQTLTRDFKTYFHEVYPSAQKNGGIRAALSSLAIIEEIEAQLAALRATVRTMLSASEIELLNRECRSRRADAYERAINCAVSRLKAEIKASEAENSRVKRQARGGSAGKTPKRSLSIARAA